MCMTIFRLRSAAGAEDHGLKLQEAEAVIVDATPVKSAARPRSHIDARRIGRKMKLLMIRTYIGHIFSADPDARWLKKGSKCTLGCQAFAGTGTKQALSTASTPRLPIAPKPWVRHDD